VDDGDRAVVRGGDGVLPTRGGPMDTSTPAELEAHLRELADALTEPAPQECVLCYVDRMLDAFGCDCTLRWARRWRDLRLPRATGLERRLEARGGFCDCEVFLNGWTSRDDRLVPDGKGDDGNGDADWPDVHPACAGVGLRSSQPCGNWVPWRRSRW